eukprot:COSAG06_NODE_1281_length_10018_cov_15.949894_9_plen_34_part_00
MDMLIANCLYAARQHSGAAADLESDAREAVASH